MKYIHIKGWDYWNYIYSIGKCEGPFIKSLDLNITDDLEGNKHYFNLRLCSLSLLEYLIEKNEFIEKSSPDYVDFIQKYTELKKGEYDFFVGEIYYPTFKPSLKECQLNNKTFFEIKSSPAAPCGAMVFIKEKLPLRPDELKIWLKDSSKLIFGEDMSFEISNVLSRNEAVTIFRQNNIW